MPNLHTWRMSANLVRPGSARLGTAPTDQEIKTAGRSDAPGFIDTVNAIQRTDKQLQKLAIEVASPTPRPAARFSDRAARDESEDASSVPARRALLAHRRSAGSGGP